MSSRRELGTKKGFTFQSNIRVRFRRRSTLSRLLGPNTSYDVHQDGLTQTDRRGHGSRGVRDYLVKDSTFPHQNRSRSPNKRVVSPTGVFQRPRDHP